MGVFGLLKLATQRDFDISRSMIDLVPNERQEKTQAIGSDGYKDCE